MTLDEQLERCRKQALRIATHEHDFDLQFRASYCDRLDTWNTHMLSRPQGDLVWQHALTGPRPACIVVAHIALCVPAMPSNKRTSRTTKLSLVPQWYVADFIRRAGIGFYCVDPSNVRKDIHHADRTLCEELRQGWIQSFSST